MDFTRPPRTYEELCLWKVFVSTTKSLDGWPIIMRWVHHHGNPFMEPEEESWVDQSDRRMFQDALQFCYRRR